MMNKIVFIIASISAALTFASCNNSDTQGESHAEETGQHDEHEEHSEGGNTESLTKAQMEAIGIQLGKIENKQLTASLKANGILNVPNQNRANVTPMLGGVVNAIYVQPGTYVQKGQRIASIANTDFIAMQQEFLSVSAKLDLAKLEYDRQKTLNEGNANALKAVQQSKAELNVLKSRKAGLQKQLNLIGIDTANLDYDNIKSTVSISSPISGSVSKILVNIGSYADSNSPIAEVIDNSRLHLDLFVYEKDLPKLKVGQTIHFTLTNNPGKEYDAEVFGIGETFENNSKAVAVHAKVKGDKKGLIDGMSITALLSLDKATVNAVPTSAIVNHEGREYIFVVSQADHDESKTDSAHHDEEHVLFERVPVARGTSDIGYSEITLLKEIPNNSKVVTEGAFFILGKMTNEGEGHAH